MILDALIHLAFVLALPPLLLGVIGKVKAFFAGRVGPPLVQPYRDLARLFRKSEVVSTTTTWVFRAGPVVMLATALVAAMLVPFGGRPAPLSFSGDLILFAYLFALARFFTVAAAMDTGSAFEGMGAAREATFAALAEPALFLAFLTLVRASGSLSLTGMLGHGLGRAWSSASASLVFVVVSLFVVLLVESSRVPFDDPATHLELTMIHEVMVLDHSGPMLGTIHYAAALKLLVLGALVARLVAPVSTGSLPLDWLVFAGSILAVAIVVGVVESVMARLRLLQIPLLLVGACLLSGFALVLFAR